MAGESVKFDRAVEYYDDTRGFPPEVEPKVGEFLAKVGNLNAQSRVLEIGIGTGRIALPLSRHVRQIYGIDLSRPMMQRLQKKQSNERIALVEGDARYLPFPDRSFDAVVAVHVFHLIPDWQQAIREVQRVLRPDSPLIFAGNMGLHGNEASRKLWDIWNEAVNDAPHNPGQEAQDHLAYLLESGWRVTGRDTLSYTHSLSLKEYVDRLEQRIWSRLWKMSDAQIANGVRAVKTYIEREFGSIDHTIEVEGDFQAGAFLPPKFA